MKINVVLHETSDEFDLRDLQNIEKMRVGFSEFNTIGPDKDYNNLENKPQINSITLEGSLTAADLSLGSIYYDTTANWNSQVSLIAEKAAIYVYSDYSYINMGSGNLIPVAGLKIGDGSSYLIDLPFVSEDLANIIFRHIANGTIHITNEERSFWNHKVSSYLDGHNTETLILSKTNYVLEGDIYYG